MHSLYILYTELCRWVCKSYKYAVRLSCRLLCHRLTDLLLSHSWIRRQWQLSSTCILLPLSLSRSCWAPFPVASCLAVLHVFYVHHKKCNGYCLRGISSRSLLTLSKMCWAGFVSPTAPPWIAFMANSRVALQMYRKGQIIISSPPTHFSSS